MTEEKDTAKTMPAAGKKKSKPDKKPAENMTYRLSDILRNTPGFEKLPKLKRKNHGKAKDNQ